MTPHGRLILRGYRYTFAGLWAGASRGRLPSVADPSLSVLPTLHIGFANISLQQHLKPPRPQICFGSLQHQMRNVYRLAARGSVPRSSVARPVATLAANLPSGTKNPNAQKHRAHTQTRLGKLAS